MDNQFPSYDMKIMLGDMNAKLGKVILTGNAVRTCDLHDETHGFLQCMVY